MAQTPEVDRSEQIVQKLEGIAQDPDLASFFRGITTEIMKPKVLDGRFTPDQYGRVLRAFNLPNMLTQEEIDREIATVRSLVDL